MEQGTAPTTELTADTDSKDFRALRERAEAAEARNAALEGRLKAQAVKLAGYDPEDGVTKLVMEKWAPDGDDFSDASFKAHAESLGHKAAADATTASTTGTGAETQLDALQQAADKLRGSSGQAPTTPTNAERIAKAQADGDWETASRLKTQSLLDAQRPTLST